jgi:hypothetical protein
MLKWQELYGRLQGIELTSEDDVVVWALERGGTCNTPITK